MNPAIDRPTPSGKLSKQRRIAESQAGRRLQQEKEQKRQAKSKRRCISMSF